MDHIIPIKHHTLDTQDNENFKKSDKHSDHDLTVIEYHTKFDRNQN